MRIIKYKAASLGLGTETASKLQPLDFSPNIINRFYNALGDLEKRQGMVMLENVSATVQNLAEYVDTSGNSTRFALTGFPDKPYTVQMGNKLIIVDGVSRNQTFTPTEGLQQLHSVVIKGRTGSSSGDNLITDPDVTNWRTQTNVAINDVVEVQQAITSSTYNAVYGLVTSVGTTSLDITTMGPAGTGLGHSSSVTVATGRPYRIFDLVELNIFPQGSYLFNDNIAIGGSQTSAKAVAVTGFNFGASDARIGDYVYNATRAAITQITAVSSNIAVVSVANQVAGDSFVFLKESMPIACYAHVHYGRLHLIDARDRTKIRVSGPNDPEDFSTFGKTLSSITIDYSSRQPQGDILLTMNTFGRYLVVGGRRAVYVTDGTNPIQDVTADVIDLDPVGLFPQGAFSADSLQNIGNEELYIGYDGLRSFLAAFDSKNTTTTNKSEQIKSELVRELQIQSTTPNNVQLIHYPRRNWVMMKVGNTIYNYNYTPTFSNGQFNTNGTFTKFTGLIAEQNAYLVQRDGSIVCGGNTGKVYQFDVSGVYTDDGINIPTTYVSPWHNLQEGESNLDIIYKDGRYIEPIFETSAQIKYNISVVGDYDEIASDSIVVTSQVSGMTFPKMPLRWRGRQAQFTITTDTSVGADIINSYTVLGNVFGRR